MLMIRRLMLSAATAATIVLAACSGGGSGSEGGGNAPPMPRNITEAVQQQASAAAALEILVEELIIAENAASDALDDERYADFDAYWREGYPDWVDRFSNAAERFAQAEQSVVMLGLTDEAQSAAARSGTDDPEHVPAKAVPVPIILLAAATFTGIAVKERERLARLNDGVDQNETQAIIEARADYLRATQGLNEIQAQVRAQADVAQVEVLRGLKNGIEHARQFASDQAVGFFSEYLPEPIKGALGLKDDTGKLSEIRNNITVLLSDPDCDTPAEPQSRAAAAKALETFPVCRVRFCNPSDLQCDGVPEADWATSVYSVDFLRDEVTVPVQSGAVNEASFTLFTPEEADAARDPGSGGGGGFNELTSASFELRVVADGVRFDPETFDSFPETRNITVSGVMLPPLVPQDCIPLADPPSDFGFGFLSQSPETVSTRLFRQVGGLIRATDCALLPIASILAGEEFGSDPVIDVEDLGAEFASVPRESLQGGDRFSAASRIVFGLTGSAVCTALTDFDYGADDGDFFANDAVCDASSRLEIVFER
jgi:hypothetical protein